jgi:hypothetical protein
MERKGDNAHGRDMSSGLKMHINPGLLDSEATAPLLRPSLKVHRGGFSFLRFEEHVKVWRGARQNGDVQKNSRHTFYSILSY